MNNKQILAGLALGAGLIGAFVAPQIASAHNGEDHTKTQKVQKITVSIDAKGFHPAAIKVKAGEEVQLTFVSKGESCANGFSIPALKETVKLKKGEKKEITFTPKKGQIIGFACNMKMFKGNITAK